MPTSTKTFGALPHPKSTYAGLLQTVTKRITPPPRVRSKALLWTASLQQSVQQHTSKNKSSHNVVPATLTLGGSLAKNTHLQGQHDYDVFVSYPLTTPADTLSDNVERLLEYLGITAQRVHGSRDYFIADVTTKQHKQKAIKRHVEFVPVYAITNISQQKNITDASLLHIKWFEQVRSEQLCREIRLCKTFLKAQHCYGAESYIGGFSGHVVDILVAHTGSFLATLQLLARFANNADTLAHRNVIVVDIMQYYANDSDALKHITTSKMQSNLVVVDPVDKTRNASAALASDVLLRASAVAQNFLQRPRLALFSRKRKITALVKKNYSKHVHLRVKPLATKKDISGSQLKRLFDTLVREIHTQGYVVTYSDWEWSGNIHNDADLFIGVDRMRRPTTKQYIGPRTTDAKQHIDAFKKQHGAGNVFVTDGRCIANKKQTAISLHSFVRGVLANYHGKWSKKYSIVS